MFKKDFGWGHKPKTLPPHPDLVNQPKTQEQQYIPRPSQTPKPRVHHSSLLLLQTFNMSQEPPGFWVGKDVFETPGCRNANNRHVFDPESPDRQYQNQYCRQVKARNEALEARQSTDEYHASTMHGVEIARDDIEEVDLQLQALGRWENLSLLMRSQRINAAKEARENNKNNRVSWFGKDPPESQEEKGIRANADHATRAVTGPAYVSTHPPLSAHRWCPTQALFADHHADGPGCMSRKPPRRSSRRRLRSARRTSAGTRHCRLTRMPATGTTETRSSRRPPRAAPPGPRS